MRASRLLRVSLAAAWLAAGAVVVAQQAPTFRSGVDLVRLDALVTQGGKPVVGLTADDFDVLDNGVRQPLRVATTAGSVSVVLVLDTSGSLEGPQLDQLIRASQAVVGLLRPEDDVSLATFSYRLLLPAGSSRDPAAIRAALASAKAGGSTAMWDALFGGLALAAGSGGRSLVLLFTAVLEEFRARYLLTYEPTGVRRDDGWHKVEVRVKGGRATVKARPGYYARPPTS